MTVIDDKYVVFKSSDWNENITKKLGDNAAELTRLYGVPDAVVLRLQDVFAKSVLYQYANSVQTTVDIISAISGGMLDEECEALIKIADRMIDFANVELETKFPD
jgi:hypothetical protein